MPLFFGTLPVILTIVVLACGGRSLTAAALGVTAAIIGIWLAFPVPLQSVVPTLLRWGPILAEVLLIVAGGLLLSEVLRQAGAQTALAGWIQDRAGQGVGAVLLVVHGITPFAESLTGFGIGVTLGIPLLAHFGIPARKVAAIGLLGLCAVPWGSMGPGTLIAATMARLSFDELGVVSGMVSVIPFVITGMVAAWMVSESGQRCRAVMQGFASGVLLTVAVTVVNRFVGTAPAGALGALLMILLHLAAARKRPATRSLSPVAKRALCSYAILLGGVLAAGLLLSLYRLDHDWRYLASPALWLFIAALWFSRGLPEREPGIRAWAAWRIVAPVTGLFIVLGILMDVSGMAAFLAQALSQSGKAYLAAGPYVGAIGGFVTGSNSGANAMFATTQAEIARTLGVDVLWFMAVHNVSAAFLLMASPGKIELAVQLAPRDGVNHRPWVQRVMLVVALAVVSAMALLNLALELL